MSEGEQTDVRIFVGPPVPIEEHIRQLREEEAQEDERTHLVGSMTREEFLGLPDEIEFLQPKRAMFKDSSQPPDEENG